MGIPGELIWTREMRADIEKRFVGYLEQPFAFRETYLMKLFGESDDGKKKDENKVQIMT